MDRRPRDYIGTQHETIGSDILAVLKTLKDPNEVLGPDVVARLTALDPAGWYPIAQLLELMELLDRRVGAHGLLTMGRTLFKMSHERRTKQEATSAADIIFGLDGMYHFANRGIDIGGWKVVGFQPGKAQLTKNTPHHCGMEQGILDEALRLVGAPSRISQTECFRKGAEQCRFNVQSIITDERWLGGRPIIPIP
ncbi:MAG: hypothetical protein Q8O67_30505 [Deltaproteobacteria bacterium]|nr:hypothetical protein [Deltaproteobacteria bacterium]